MCRCAWVDFQSSDLPRNHQAAAARANLSGGANAKFHGFLEFPRFLSVFGGGIVSGLRVCARLVQGASQGLTPGLKRLCEACAGFATVLGLVALGV